MGSVASAAPMFLMTSGVPGDSYYDTVGESYTHYYPTCAQAITTGFSTLQSLFATQDYKSIQGNLSLCSLPNSISVYTIVKVLKDAFAHISQFNYPYRNQFEMAWPVEFLCNTLNTRRVSSVSSWALPLHTALNLTFNHSASPVSCFLPNTLAHPLEAQHLMQLTLNTRLRTMHTPPSTQPPTTTTTALTQATTDTTAFMYTVCTEFFQPQGGVGIFVYDTTWDYKGILTYCQTLFPGSQPRPYPAPLGQFSNPTAGNTTNIIFSNGLFDPIRNFSPMKDLSTSVVALNVDRMAHCLDINMQRVGDPTPVTQARSQELSIIKGWLSGK